MLNGSGPMAQGSWHMPQGSWFMANKKFGAWALGLGDPVLGTRYTQKNISCFRKILVPYSRFPRFLSYGASSLSGARLFQKRQNGFPEMLRLIRIIFFEKVWTLFLICFRCYGVSQDKNNWLLGWVAGPKILKS